MPACIFELKDYRTIIRSSTHVKFPQLYRLRGEYFDIPALEKYDIKRGTGNFSEYFYSFSPTGADVRIQWASIESQPIKGLDPKIDESGWVIIRHHQNSDIARGHQDALFDRFLGLERDRSESRIILTDEGHFTLQCRPPTPGAPDHLVIYALMVPDTRTHPIAMKYSTGWVDEFTIVMPDGTITLDSDILYEPD